jgi:hypothetical protein
LLGMGLAPVSSGNGKGVAFQGRLRFRSHQQDTRSAPASKAPKKAYLHACKP